jgi:hypothetical protein
MRAFFSSLPPCLFLPVATRGVGADENAPLDRGLHRFAHSDLHRAAWRLWNKLSAAHAHLHIWHEMFDAPAGRWESVHVNGAPNMLAAAALARPLPGPADDDGGDDDEASAGAEGEGRVQWVSVAVDATGGRLRTSRGRLGQSDGTDNDVYGEKGYGTGKVAA